MSGPLETAPDGMFIRVRLAPAAAHNAVLGLHEEADGTVYLKASVTAAPEGGKANAALIKLLAKSWRLPKSAISVIRGETDRRKLLHIEGDPRTLERRLLAWLKERGETE